MMVYLLAFIVLGYLLCRFRLISEKAQEVMSYLSTTWLMLILVFNAFYAYFSPERLRESLQYLAMQTGSWAVIFFLGYVIAKRQGLSGGRLGAWLENGVFTNVGYIGISVVQALDLGAASFLYNGLTIILSNLLMGAFAQPLIRRFAGTAEKKRASAWGVIFSGPMLGFLLGLAVYFFALPVPLLLRRGLTQAGKITAPMVMLLIGCKLFKCGLKEIFGDKKLYFFSLTQLLLYPLTVFFLGSLVSPDRMMLMILTVMTACPAAAILPVYTTLAGGDSRWCTRLVFLSTLLSVITLPLVLLLAGN